jgi:hypothetical protein
MVAERGIVFPVAWGSRNFKADGLDERVEIIDDTQIETVKLGSLWASSRASDLTGLRRPAVSSAIPPVVQAMFRKTRQD